jgi:hypothetical protein
MIKSDSYDPGGKNHVFRKISETGKWDYRAITFGLGVTFQ